MANKKSLVTYESKLVDPQQLQAINILRDQEIPRAALKTRPGKGGKSFTYIDHVWITRLLIGGFRNQWSFRVLDWETYTDKLKIRDQMKTVRTVAARCELTLRYLIDQDKRSHPSDPYFMDQVVTEVGVFEPNPAMPMAMAIASAVSRGLCRCVARALGVGLQFYGNEEEMTSARAWTDLKKFASNNSIVWGKEQEGQLVEKLKEAGITKENLVDRYTEAFKIVSDMLSEELTEMP